MASADSPGSPLGFQTPPPLPRWPLEAMMASRHLQSPESGSQQRSRAGFRTRQVPKRPLESRKASKASAHPGRSLEAIRGRAGLQDTSAHSGLVTWVAQGFHVPPGTQTSSRRPPDLQTPPSPILYTYDLWRPVRRLNGLPDNFAHPTGPLKTARHRQTKPDKTLSNI